MWDQKLKPKIGSVFNGGLSCQSAAQDGAQAKTTMRSSLSVVCVLLPRLPPSQAYLYIVTYPRELYSRVGAAVGGDYNFLHEFLMLYDDESESECSIYIVLTYSTNM